MRIKKEVFIFLIFFLIGIGSRALFASKDFTHMDGVLYAVGTFDYNIKDSMPPAPGYFLYIMSAKLLNLFTHDPHTSLMLLSIFYSGLIAGALYYFGTSLKGQMAGVVSALLFLTSPLFWYKGVTIFGYLNSGFFILLTALLGYKVVVEKKKTLIFWFSISFAILIGVRPQELAVMLPLYIYVLFHMRPKEAVFSVVVFLFICFLWLVPLISMSGGIDTYLSALNKDSGYVIYDSVMGGNPVSKINNHLVRMGRYFQWAYFLGIVPLVYYIGRFFYLPNIVNDKKVQFFAVWILPTVIYNVLIQFGEIGHGMSWGLGLFLILGESIVVLCNDILQLLQRPYLKTVAYFSVLGPIIFVNFFMFFYDFDKGRVDFYSFEKYRQFNYKDVFNRNRYLTSKIGFIKEHFKSEDLLILTSGVFSYETMFRLPEAIVIQPNIIYKKGSFHFSLFNSYKKIFYENKFDFEIPRSVTKLIVFDDIFFTYVQTKKNSTYYDIGDSYKLLAYDVSRGEKIYFDYHSIRIE